MAAPERAGSALPTYFAPSRSSRDCEKAEKICRRHAAVNRTDSVEKFPARQYALGWFASLQVATCSLGKTRRRDPAAPAPVAVLVRDGFQRSAAYLRDSNTRALHQDCLEENRQSRGNRWHRNRRELVSVRAAGIEPPRD